MRDIGRRGETAYRELLLARDAQDDPARDDQREAWGTAHQRGDVRCRRHDLLEVVEDEEGRPVREPLNDQLEERPAAGLEDPEGRRDARDDHRRIAHRLKGNEEDATGKLVGRGRRDLERQPGLARASGSGQGEQPDGLQESECLLHLAGPPHEGGELRRQIVRSGVEAAQGREVSGKSLGDRLAQPLRGAEVLQPMLPEIAQ